MKDNEINTRALSINLEKFFKKTGLKTWRKFAAFANYKIP